MPKPGPEHKLFEMDAGTWDATVEMFMPGAPPMTSQGTETNTIGCGGLCLISDFKSEMAGAPFHGHGTVGLGPGQEEVRGHPDRLHVGRHLHERDRPTTPPPRRRPAGMEGPDMTGKLVKSKGVVQYKDANNRVFTMYMTGPDGKEVPSMKISYTQASADALGPLPARALSRAAGVPRVAAPGAPPGGAGGS